MPDSVEINDFDVESRIVGYESISNYYKLKHYYFFLIITNEVIPILSIKIINEWRNGEIRTSGATENATVEESDCKNDKTEICFYNLHSQGDLYGMWNADK